MPSFVASRAEIAQHVSLTLSTPSEPIARWGPSLDVAVPGSIPTATPGYVPTTVPGDVPTDSSSWIDKPVEDVPPPPPAPLPEPSVVDPSLNIIQSFEDNYSFDDSFDDFGPYNTGDPKWAGAVIPATPGQTLNTITAELTVPKPGPSTVASWVGLDGYGSSDVAQAGVITGPNGVTAFDEWAPGAPNTISASAFQANPGDTIKITASTGAGADTAKFIFDDITTGKTYQTSLTAPSGVSLSESSAEAVVEAPHLGSLIGSSPIQFTDISAGYSDGTSASLSDAVPLSTMHAYGSVHPDTSSVLVVPHHS